MAKGNLRKSSRIEARKRELRVNDFDSTLSQEQPGSAEIVNCTPNYHNGKKSPEGFKNSRRAGREKPMNSSDENGLLVLVSSEMKHFNAKESKSYTSENTQYHSGMSDLLLNSGKDSQLHVIDHIIPEKRKSFVCDVCSKTYLDKNSYNRHIKSHCGNRKFQCDVCEKKYTESCSLKRHKKTHENDRPFLCDLCLKSFRDSSSLIRHQVIHTEREKMYHCSKCEKSFMDKHGLKRHEQVHTGLRLHSCHVCSKSFSDSGSLNRHLKIHSGVKNYFCPSCNKRFLEKQSLVRHQRSVCKLVNSSALMQLNSFDVDRSCDSLYSGAEYSELSKHSVNDKSSAAGYRAHLSTVLPVLVSSSSSIFSKQKDSGKMYAKANSDSPSLHSLIKKDPDLYSSISELVESIDSYEKLLHLCGEKGQDEIDAALAKDTAPLPENLLCFECGELLVEGDNFHSEGKEFLALSSYRCLSCQEDYDYGDPSVLTPEGLLGEPLTPSSRYGEDDEVTCSFDTQDKSFLQRIESFTAMREKLLTEQDVDFKGPGLNGVSGSMYPKLTPNKTVEFKFHVKKENGLHLQNTTKAVSDAEKETQEGDQPTDGSIDKDKQSSYNSMTAEISDYPCHLCTEVFTTPVLLNQHLKQHSCSPFTCMVCSESFANSSSLRHHLTTHTGGKPFSCPHCRKQFWDPSNFSTHKKTCTFTSTTVSSEPFNTPQQSFNHIDSNEKDKMESTAKKRNLSPVLPPGLTSPEALHEKFEKVAMTIKEGNLLVSCELCSKEFKSEQLWEMHMRYHSGNPDVTCIECGRSFSDASSLKRHARLHAGIKPHMCEYCHRGYCDNWGLKKHKARGCMAGELKVSVELLHPCPQCTRVFSEAHFKQDHMKSHKGLLRFECDICPKKFSEAFNLKRHRQLHMVKCSGCEQELKDKSSLTEHKKTCPANDRNRFLNYTDGFPCPTCGRTYATKAYLERHKKFHSDLKPHACEVCNKRFSEGFRLKRHMKVHSGTKPFTCDGCKKGFSDSPGLKRHKISLACKYYRSQMQNVQQSPRELSCPICSKIFQRNYLLVRHMAVHSLDRPFSCKQCGKSYKDTSSLKRHQQVHSGIKSYVCLVCGKGFYYSDSLRRHKFGSCSQKYNTRQPLKSKKRSKAKNSSNDKYTIIKSESMNSRKSMPAKTNQNTTLSEQLTLANGKLNGIKVMVEPSKKSLSKTPSSKSKRNNFRSLLHPRQALSWTSKRKLYQKQPVHESVKIFPWPKQYHCSSCFLSFNRKVYLALHNRAH